MAFQITSFQLPQLCGYHSKWVHWSVIINYLFIIIVWMWLKSIIAVYLVCEQAKGYLIIDYLQVGLDLIIAGIIDLISSFKSLSQNCKYIGHENQFCPKFRCEFVINGITRIWTIVHHPSPDALVPLENCGYLLFAHLFAHLKCVMPFVVLLFIIIII